MRTYIIGAILEAQDRARVLKSKVKSNHLSVHFNQLEQVTNLNIDDTIQLLSEILSAPAYQDERNQRERFNQFKKIIGSLDLLENVAVAALSRSHPDDEFLNELMDKIRKEINYPIPAPVVSCLSQKYYSIYPVFNLMCIPLLESDFLLHIPDMFHELAHPIIDLENNPKVEPFRTNLAKFNNIVLRYFKSEIDLEQRKVGPRTFVDLLHNWNASWMEGWSIEIFCDLFGLFTVGPAFAWSHLHLSVKRNRHPHRFPIYSISTHPPDHSRMTALLYGLDLLGFRVERKLIESKWNEYLQISRYEKIPELDRAIPTSLLEHAATLAYEGTKNLGCRIPCLHTSDRIYSLLNEAWRQFWIDPTTYLHWEKNEIKKLRDDISPVNRSDNIE